MLVDDVMPVYDISDSVATVVNADVETTWAALMSADLMDVGRRRPLVGLLGAMRAMPGLLRHLVKGERPPAAPSRMCLRDMVSLPPAEGGWVLLGERDADEIALGLVGKFWRPVIPFEQVSCREFRDWSQPGYAKTVYSLAVRPLDAHRTLLTGTMRTATTDAAARRAFRWYWTIGVGSGAHVLVQGLLDVVRETAEAGLPAQRSTSGGWR